ncbi:sensor histidine kinase [Cohnella silvisoli]|uniref:Histidine kinase n=1 Tax=Cohnella silvisoli TaxID=2873699 RepID=A0ABV1KR64_9BACL|nr:histidine kinase [Cohnella silvisoli]MCD9021720.1 histidine kinase [Cohnella silvisoli]
MVLMKELFKEKWKMSIFGRLVITFLLIIFPIYVLSIEIYQWAIQTQKQDISNTMLSQVNFYMENLEKEIQRIKLLQYYSTDDVNLHQLAFVPESLDDYGKAQTILQLQQHLKAIASSSSYITSANAYIPSINRVVSSSTFESSIPKEEFNILDTNSYNSKDAQTIYWNNRLFLSISNLSNTPIDTKNKVKKKPAYIIAVELNLSVLEDALKQFNTYKNGGALLIDLQNDFILTSTNNTEENSRVAEFVKEAVKTAKSGSENIKVMDKAYWAIYTSSDYLGFTLSKYIPESEVLKAFKKYSNWFWIFTATAILLILLYSFSTYRLIYKPLSLLVKSFRKMEKGDLNISIAHKTDNEFRYLYGAFNKMVDKFGTLIEQVYKQKILAQNAQLKQLQTQIVPHFLYNSYFILHRMVLDEDNENAARFSEQLGNYLKFITRSAGDEVTLASEIEHARIYTEILSMRFASRMKIEFEETPEQCSPIRVPRLIIQPIIENALEHGLENKASGGILIISFVKSEEVLDIVVEDNGNSLNNEELEALQKSLVEKDHIDEVEMTGIKNIHRRLQYSFGNDSGLIFSRSGLGGLKVVIRIVG